MFPHGADKTSPKLSALDNTMDFHIRSFERAPWGWLAFALVSGACSGKT
jgi:hypothetical protein